jgi:hypothetical protein
VNQAQSILTMWLGAVGYELARSLLRNVINIARRAAEYKIGLLTRRGGSQYST